MRSPRGSWDQEKEREGESLELKCPALVKLKTKGLTKSSCYHTSLLVGSSGLRLNTHNTVVRVCPWKVWTQTSDHRPQLPCSLASLRIHAGHTEAKTVRDKCNQGALEPLAALGACKKTLKPAGSPEELCPTPEWAYIIQCRQSGWCWGPGAPAGMTVNLVLPQRSGKHCSSQGSRKDHLKPSMNNG